MDYLRNNCWCSNSNWGNEHYNCQIVVTLYSYEEDDWNRVITTKDYYDEQEANDLLKYYIEDSEKTLTREEESKFKKLFGTKTVNVLKPEVIEWLGNNVHDFEGGKGWCVGNDNYNIPNYSYKYHIFFQRRKDAMKFIKTWSKWKKPVNYCQYFTDVRKKLNLETLKYEEVK